MGLITCPDCGKDVSDQAAACIHCGRPMTPGSQISETTSPDLKLPAKEKRIVLCPGCRTLLDISKYSPKQWIQCSKCKKFFYAPIGKNPYLAGKHSKTSSIIILFAILFFIVGFIFIRFGNGCPSPSPSRTTSKQIPTSQKKMVTMDGTENGQLQVYTINIWKDYNNRDKGMSGTVNHGDKVFFVKRQGNGVLIETQGGQRGWVTHYFIKEFK